MKNYKSSNFQFDGLDFGELFEGIFTTDYLYRDNPFKEKTQPVKIEEKSDRFEIHIPISNVGRKDISVAVDNYQLKVTGKNLDYSYKIGKSFDIDKIRARLFTGVLIISLYKEKKKVTSRKIDVF